MNKHLLPLLFLLLLPIQTVFAQVTDDAVNAVAKGLYCPVCESEPLDTCGTQACQDWREEIRVQLGNGATQAEIHEYFRSRYGDRVLAQPPAEGFNLVLWLGIPFVLIVGGVFFGRYLRAISHQPSAISHIAGRDPAAQQTAVSDDYVARIEEELSQS